MAGGTIAGGREDGQAARAAFDLATIVPHEADERIATALLERASRGRHADAAALLAELRAAP